MRLTQYFLPLLKETPQEAAIPSHKLMLRAGMICQEATGIYSWLPFGLKVLRKIERIIEEEQEKIHCNQLIMPTIQSADLWRESGRYDSYGKEMLRIQDRHEKELLYGPTHEEVVTSIFKRYVKSYKQLPVRLFQIHWKFRDEIRPRFGVMRGREFLMKDAYSFDLTPEKARESYFAMFRSYLNMFKKMGVPVMPVRAETGAIGGELSHEFHVLADTGESALYYDKRFDAYEWQEGADLRELMDFYARDEALHNPDDCPLAPESLAVKRGIEIGHIFSFGTKYTESMHALVTNEKGEQVAPYCGSYGIGVGRLVPAIIEAFHDDHGIRWPKAVAPFDAGLINLKPSDETTNDTCNALYGAFKEGGLDILHDDTADSPGVKFNRMDLIGLPLQVTVGPKGLKNGQVEIKNRWTGQRETVPVENSVDCLRVFHQEL